MVKRGMKDSELVEYPFHETKSLTTKEPIIKLLRKIIIVWEKNTGRGQDGTLSRLRKEPVRVLKSKLKYYLSKEGASDYLSGVKGYEKDQQLVQLKDKKKKK